MPGPFAAAPFLPRHPIPLPISMLALLGIGGGALASVTTTAAFPYEQMVSAKLSRMSRTDAAEYLDRRSTRFMLREAGVSDATVDAARAIVMTNEDVKAMAGLVVPTNTGAATDAAVPPTMTWMEVDEMNQRIKDKVGDAPRFIAADPMFLDESAALAAAAFPIDEAALIAKAKAFLFYGQGVERPELLNEDFVFMGPGE